MEFKKKINTNKIIYKYILHCIITIPLFCIPFIFLIINIDKIWATIVGVSVIIVFISLFVPYIYLIIKYLIDIATKNTISINDIDLKNVSSQRFLCAIMINRKFIQELISPTYTLIINLHIDLLNKPMKLILYISKKDFDNSDISKIIARNVVGNYENFMLTSLSEKCKISVEFLKYSKIIKSVSFKII